MKFNNVCGDKGEWIIIEDTNCDKLVNDFIYMFEPQSYSVIKIDECEGIMEQKGMILCTRYFQQAKKLLKKVGLKYKKHYFLAEDMFYQFNYTLDQYDKVFIMKEKNWIKDLGFFSDLYDALEWGAN